MEKIEEYRHLIEPEVKKLFLDSIKKAIKEVDKTKFGFIGIIGSIKEEKNSHDIDLLIFPGQKAKIGETIIEIERLYENVEKYLKEHNERYYLAASPKKAIQELIYYLASIEEGAAGLIPIHSLFFTNYRDFKSFNPERFQERIKSSLITLYGNFDILKKLPEIPQKLLEPYFFVLDFEMTSRIKTFPRHLIRASAESLFSYLKQKYDIEVNDKIPTSISEVNKEFRKLIKILDERTYSSNKTNL